MASEVEGCAPPESLHAEPLTKHHGCRHHLDMNPAGAGRDAPLPRLTHEKTILCYSLYSAFRDFFLQLPPSSFVPPQTG